MTVCPLSCVFICVRTDYDSGSDFQSQLCDIFCNHMMFDLSGDVNDDENTNSNERGRLKKKTKILIMNPVNRIEFHNT